MYLGLMIWPVLALARMFNIVWAEVAPHSRIRAVAETPRPVKDGEEPVPAGRGERRRPFVRFCYPQTTHPALENVNFRLKPGQMLGICGPTGAGKHNIVAYPARHLM